MCAEEDEIISEMINERVGHLKESRSVLLDHIHVFHSRAILHVETGRQGLWLAYL